MTFAARQTLAAAANSSIEANLAAKLEAVGHRLCRENMRSVTPETEYSFAPNRNASPDMRASRTGGEEILGAQAL